MNEMRSSDKLVGTDWVAANLNDPTIRIVEVGDLKDPDAYFTSHIPGSIQWPWDEALFDDAMRQFVSPEAFADLMSKSGIGPDTTIVLYSSLCQYATFAFWVCHMRGHHKLKVIDGNRGLWIKEGRPVTQEIPAIKPTRYPVRPSDESCRIGWKGVLDGLGNPDRVLLDLRTPEEYHGERVSPAWFEVDHGAVRKGHIPGARHFYYMNLLYDDETYRPPDELRASFEGIGATPDKEVVLYCRLSHRGTLGWFVARYLLGYPRVKVYDGSWTEWGSMFGMPIVNESMGREN